jgi:hypothetical protein
VDQWDTEDVRVLSNLIAGSMVETAEAIITAPAERPDVEREIVRTAERQLRMVVIGAANWHSRPRCNAGSWTLHKGRTPCEASTCLVQKQASPSEAQPDCAVSHRPIRLPSLSRK